MTTKYDDAVEGEQLLNDSSAENTANESNVETSLALAFGGGECSTSSSSLPRVDIQFTPAETGMGDVSAEDKENTFLRKNSPQHETQDIVEYKAEDERATSPLHFLVSAGVEILSQSFSRDDENDCALRFDLLTTTNDDEQEDDGDGDSVTSAPYFAPADLDPRNWVEGMDAPTFGFALVALAVIVTHPILSLTGALAVGGGYNLARLACLATEGSTADDADAQPEGPELPGTSAATINKAEIDDPSATDESSTVDDVIDGEVQQSTTILTTDDLLPDDWVDRYPELNHEVIKDVEMVGLNALEFFHVVST